MDRNWTRAPSGGDYLVIAGAAGKVESALEDTPASGVAVVFGGHMLAASLGRLVRWRGRGMVAVQHRDQRWVWVTKSRHAAYELGNMLTALLTSGGWDPETMPPPVFPGAEAR